MQYIANTALYTLYQKKKFPNLSHVLAFFNEPLLMGCFYFRALSNIVTAGE